MFIYKLTNKVNNKVYIGQTTQNIMERYWCHMGNTKQCPAIFNAVKKYGKENFTIEEIDGANSLSELNYLEQHYIYKYNSLVPNGYNIRAGGGNSRLSEERKKQIGDFHRGRKRPQSTIDKHKLYNPAEATRQKIRESKLGSKLSDETKRKISESHKGKKIPPEVALRSGASRRGKPHSSQHREAIRLAHEKNIVTPVLNSIVGEFLKLTSSNHKRGHNRVWEVICKCGKTNFISTTNLKRKKTPFCSKTCGMSNSEAVK